jgi:hypothetical protein
MGTWDYILLLGAGCGVVMVVGGILLLYKGAISLTNVAGEEAFTIEFKKELRISTQYPALGIFVIGLLFIALSVYVGKPDINKITLKAKTVDVAEPVNITVKANSWSSGLTHTGEIIETIYPNIDNIQVIVSAPGYENESKTINISSLKNGVADLGEIQLHQKLAKSAIDTSQIVSLPADVAVPGIAAKPAFGGVR